MRGDFLTANGKSYDFVLLEQAFHVPLWLQPILSFWFSPCMILLPRCNNLPVSGSLELLLVVGVIAVIEMIF